MSKTEEAKRLLEFSLRDGNSPVKVVGQLLVRLGSLEAELERVKFELSQE